MPEGVGLPGYGGNGHNLMETGQGRGWGQTSKGARAHRVAQRRHVTWRTETEEWEHLKVAACAGSGSSSEDTVVTVHYFAFRIKSQSLAKALL